VTKLVIKGYPWEGGGEIPWKKNDRRKSRHLPSQSGHKSLFTRAFFESREGAAKSSLWSLSTTKIQREECPIKSDLDELQEKCRKGGGLAGCGRKGKSLGMMGRAKWSLDSRLLTGEERLQNKRVKGLYSLASA